MASILDIREKLLHTQAAIAQTERAIATHPDRSSLLVEIRSLQSRLRNLESQFLRCAEAADAVDRRILWAERYRALWKLKLAKIKNENR